MINRDALSILAEVSDEFGLAWNAESMLYIACEYIDNQQSGATFQDFVLRSAEDEASGTDLDDFIMKTQPQQKGN